jgi:hypothetical protein
VPTTEIREILEEFNSAAEEEAFFKLLEIPGDLLLVLAAAFRTEHILRFGRFSSELLASGAIPTHFISWLKR